MLYGHPATRFTCRHCGADAGYETEMCFYCGPVCGKCWNDPGKCAGQIRYEKENIAKQQAQPAKKRGK